MNSSAKFRLLPAMLAALLLAAAGPALAQEEEEPSQGMAEFDANADGQISEDEANASGDLSTSFGDLDANQDGMLDESEFSRFEEGLPGSGEQPVQPEEEPGMGEGSPLDEAPAAPDLTQ